MYIMSKLDAISLIAHSKIINEVTIDNYFMGLNMISIVLCSDFGKNFLIKMKFLAPYVLQSIVSATFSIFVCLCCR